MMDRADAFPTVAEGTDTLGRFAADLRELRHTSGNPTLQSLSLTTHVSKSVLSDAFAGKRMPSANTVRRLAQALDADEEAWERRRERLTAAVSDRLRESVAPPRRRSIPLVTALWIFAATAFLAVVTSTAIANAFDIRLPKPGELARTLPDDVLPVRGADPMRTACARDASAERSEVQGEGTVLLTLLHSPSCEAMWAHATILRGGEGVLTVEVFPASDRYGGLAKRRSAMGSTSVHTGMVKGPALREGVCAVASFEGGGELARPLCIPE